MTSVTRSSNSARSTRIETRSCSAIIRSRRFGFSAAAVVRNCSSARLARAAVGELLDEARALVEADLAAGDRRPVALLVLVEELRVDALPLALDDRDAAADVGRDRHEPRRRRESPARAALRAAARRRRDARALAVEVRVEERVERDDALVVRRALRDEVDDDARFLARMHAHDAADPLLVHALRRGRREVHADRRARRVPALGEQLRVDEDVDLAALVGGERLGEAHRRRPAGDRLRLQPGGAELLSRGCTRGRLRPRRRCPACCRSGRGRGSRPPVQRLVVERLREDLLVEVAADDRHRVDRGDRRHAQVAQRRDEPAARGVLQRQVVDRGGEDVGDLLRDQLLGRRHADVDGLRERADRGGGLLPERRVRLVADDELVRVAVDRVDVAREPRVRLDRERRRLSGACRRSDHVA